MLVKAKKMLKKIDEILFTLPVDLRMVMHLHFIEGVSLKEVSFILSENHRNLRCQLSRGLKLLKQNLNSDGIDVDQDSLINLLAKVSQISNISPQKKSNSLELILNSSH